VALASPDRALRAASADSTSKDEDSEQHEAGTAGGVHSLYSWGGGRDILLYRILQRQQTCFTVAVPPLENRT
jgi:hypothetical protein